MAEYENGIQDVKGQDVATQANEKELAVQLEMRNDLQITRPIANEQEMFLEKYESDDFIPDMNPTKHVSPREASGAIDFWPRLDWRAKHVVFCLWFY